MENHRKSFSNSQGFNKIVRQRNHDGGRIPEALREYSDQPLYILVALWCYQQKKWIGKKQISSVFLITERRASFLLTYIQRKKGMVDFLTRKIKPDGERFFSHEIRIKKVHLKHSESKSSVHHSSPHK